MEKNFTVKNISYKNFLIFELYIFAAHNRRNKAILIARPAKKEYFEMLIFIFKLFEEFVLYSATFILRIIKLHNRPPL
ncbi:MAG: hypothetical protein CVU54_18460 [Deltaproteobacteria bacterium HGW-Deltaproteobacteria-12]|nr:MAG: hypothetical protein CVU54_18460 [Deltaproteobacteria bacterium HGW-Deltaproteobacteria-12]